MSYYDCDETDRAVELYFRRMKRLGQIDGAMQPNRYDTCRDGDMITIATLGHMVLARYRVLPDGKLRRLRVLAEV